MKIIYIHLKNLKLLMILNKHPKHNVLFNIFNRDTQLVSFFIILNMTFKRDSFCVIKLALSVTKIHIETQEK